MGFNPASGWDKLLHFFVAEIIINNNNNNNSLLEGLVFIKHLKTVPKNK